MSLCLAFYSYIKNQKKGLHLVKDILLVLCISILSPKLLNIKLTENDINTKMCKDQTRSVNWLTYNCNYCILKPENYRCIRIKSLHNILYSLK